MPNRPVSDVIRNKPFVTVSPHASIREAALLMKANHMSAVMVVDGRKMLKGICTERDIVFEVVSKGRDPEHTHVSSVMTEHPRTVCEDKPFGHALHLMYEGGFRHVPVVDGAGHPVGMLAARDAVATDALEFGDDLEWREEITVIL